MSPPAAETSPPRAARFGPALAVGVARVPAAEPALHRALALSWLRGDEHARCARFQVDHGRADFLAGRMAAKAAVQALAATGVAPHDWEIRSGVHHQPGIAHAFPGCGVSIAHADGVGVALAFASPLRCGVDLEPLSRTADDVIATQVTPAEAAWARAGGAAERERWLVLWTAREAQGKSFGTGLLEPDQLRPTAAWVPVAHGWQAQIVGDDDHQVRSVCAAGRIVSLVLPKEIEAEAIAQWLAAVGCIG